MQIMHISHLLKACIVEVFALISSTYIIDLYHPPDTQSFPAWFEVHACHTKGMFCFSNILKRDQT